jgi:hypothetical protein
MAEWHPDAIRVAGESSGPHATGAGWKIVHHTTEGSSAGGAIGAYRSHRGWPTLTAEWTGARLVVYQHMPLTQAARALQNAPDAWETNRARCVQIEHVGFARETGSWPAARYAAMAELCRWLEAQTGCRRGVLPGTVWDTATPPRIGAEAFHRGTGHTGHQHVPGNSHWDPGVFRIDAVLDGDRESAHRPLRGGEDGPDVRALQLRAAAVMRNSDRPELAPAVDGVFGPQTSQAVMTAAWVLGVGGFARGSGWLFRLPISVRTQQIVRHPSRRSTIQRARTPRRREQLRREGRR